MTNDIEKIQTVDNTEHGLKLDSGILSYIRTGITNVKQALDALFSGKADTSHTHSTSEGWLSTIVNNLTTLINGKAASATTLTGYGITDAYTKTQVDVSLNGRVKTLKETTNSPIDISTLLNDEESTILHLTWTGTGTKLENVITGISSGHAIYEQCGPKNDIEYNHRYFYYICRHGSTSTANYFILAISGLALESHTHTKSQITDFAHTHDQSDVNGLTSALAGKADTSALSNKADISNSVKFVKYGGASNLDLSDIFTSGVNAAQVSVYYDNTEEEGLPESIELSDFIIRSAGSSTSVNVDFSGDDGSYELTSDNFVVLNIWKGDLYNPETGAEFDFHVSIAFKGENV